MLVHSDTIAALATPVGTAALAILRASGPAVADLTRRIFAQTAVARVATHSDYRDIQEHLLDDVVFTFFAAPNSYTGEDLVEISCHGNPLIAQKILGDLLARGCRPAEAGEFTKRAFLNGRLDLSQAEAVMDLINARSERALAAANQQLRGSLGRQMEALISLLLALLAQLEAYIDFPEEDLPAEDQAGALRSLNVLLDSTRGLIATSRYGDVLRDGLKVVIIGETNAGKSSLLNRLVGHERALVSPEPGTTRDYLEEGIALGPHYIRLVDTAGLNPSATSLEELGIKKTFEQAAEADLFLWVIDSTSRLPVLPKSLAATLDRSNTLAIKNKCDLPGSSSEKDTPLPFPTISISALTGFGLDALRSAIVSTAEAIRPDIGEELITINARHAHSLDRAIQALGSAKSKIENRSPIELTSSDLREALDCFGEISGRVDNERLLDQLFSRFCIGK